MPNLVNRAIAMSCNRQRNTLITWKLQRNGQGPMSLPVGGFAHTCAKRTRVQFLHWGKQRSTSWQRVNARNFAKELLARLGIWASSTVVSQTIGKNENFQGFLCSYFLSFKDSTVYRKHQRWQAQRIFYTKWQQHCPVSKQCIPCSSRRAWSLLWWFWRVLIQLASFILVTHNI